MSSFFFLRHRSKSLLCNLSYTRAMGGGPRTFPGGLNKWQFKRMHEKLAREKEHRLLQQEKQIYQARLRTEIRAKTAGKSPSHDSSGGGRMSSKDHIRALADRFMKEGAEDLWNEDDGPIRSPNHSRSYNAFPPRPLDLRKIVTEKRAAVASFENRRNYSKWSRGSSSDEDEDVVRLEGGLLKKFDGDSFRGRSDGEKMMSKAALRNFDAKVKERRVPRADIEQSDLSGDIREFYQEMRNRETAESDRNRKMVDGGSILTQKR